MTDPAAVPAIPEATDRDVLITRAFDAPRDVVWRFFTQPEYLATWFGPNGVHVDRASVTVEPHVGGRWELDMVDDTTGDRYPIRSVFRAYDPMDYFEGVVTADTSSIPNSEDIVLRVWFHDHGAKTRITLHQGPFDPEFKQPTIEGWEESFEKIDAQLEEAEA